jgi:hypothetical protein
MVGAVTKSAWSQRPADVRDFMRAKLSHSQSVLDGLAREDYGVIANHAQKLSLLSQAANWQVLQTPEYLRHSTDFRKSAEMLLKAAQDENLDGAALSYVAVTLKCVSCHKYVRSVRMASASVKPIRTFEKASLRGVVR